MRTSIVSAWKRSFLLRKGYDDSTVDTSRRCPTRPCGSTPARHWGINPTDAVTRIAHNGRGGYCYHLNGAFGLLLRSLGYSVHAHVGAVHGTDSPDDNSTANHLVLTVDVRTQSARYTRPAVVASRRAAPRLGGGRLSVTWATFGSVARRFRPITGSRRHDGHRRSLARHHGQRRRPDRRPFGRPVTDLGVATGCTDATRPGQRWPLTWSFGGGGRI